jgi:hypothetical protein
MDNQALPCFLDFEASSLRDVSHPVEVAWRAKLIVFVTRPLLDHLSNDADVLDESRLLKRFAESYCVRPQQIQAGMIKAGREETRPCVLRRR